MRERTEKIECKAGFTISLPGAADRVSRIALWSLLICLFLTKAANAGEMENLPGFESAADTAFSTYIEWIGADSGDEGVGFDFNETPPRPMRPLGYGADKPPAEKIYIPEDMRQIGWIGSMKGIPGVAVGGALPRGLSYELRYSSTDAKPDVPFFQAIEKETFVKIDRVDVEHAYGGSLRWRTPFQGLQLGGSLFHIQMKADVTPMEAPFWALNPERGQMEENVLDSASAWMASARKKFGNLSLSAEYYQNRYSFVTDGDDVTLKIGEGYQGGAAYRLTPWLELGSSYSIYYADKDDKEGEAWTSTGKNPAEAWIRDFGVSARFDINPNWMFQVEGHFMNGLIGTVQGADEDWTRFGAKMTLKF